MLIKIDMFEFVNIGDALIFKDAGKEYAVIGKTIDRVMLSGNGEKFSITRAHLNRDASKKKIERVWKK